MPELRDQALQNMGGYLLFEKGKTNVNRLRYFDPNDKSYLNLTNYGGLITPPKDVEAATQKLEDIFRAMDITTDNLLKSLLEQSSSVNALTEPQKKKFFLARIYKRAKELNTILRRERQTKSSTDTTNSNGKRPMDDNRPKDDNPEEMKKKRKLNRMKK